MMHSSQQNLIKGINQFDFEETNPPIIENANGLPALFEQTLFDRSNVICSLWHRIHMPLVTVAVADGPVPI